MALALAEAGLRRFPEDWELLELAGDAALEMGHADRAEEYYRRIQATSPRLSDWARLAHVAEMRGDLAGAATLMGRALEAGFAKGAPPESIAWCYAILGELELKHGSPQMARQLYAKGREHTPDHPLVLEHLAELEARDGNLPPAESLYRGILKQHPGAALRPRLAAVLERQGKQKEAAREREESRRFFERAVEAGNESYLRPLAELELWAGSYGRAAELAARDLALRPNAESRALLMEILRAAAAAGRPVDSFSPK